LSEFEGDFGVVRIESMGQAKMDAGLAEAGIGIVQTGRQTVGGKNQPLRGIRAPEQWRQCR